MVMSSAKNDSLRHHGGNFVVFLCKKNERRYVVLIYIFSFIWTKFCMFFFPICINEKNSVKENLQKCKIHEYNSYFVRWYKKSIKTFLPT